MSIKRSNGQAELVWGRCKWYNQELGYGWITLPGGQCDVFVHAKQLKLSGIQRPLEQGELVGCHLHSSTKGWYAVNISLNGD